MSHHLVLGSGPVGTATARLLAERGASVVLASRSGAGPDLPAVARIALDVTDQEATARAAEHATVVYNCVNPAAYHRWPQLWPPMADSVLAAAQRSGAVLATVSNLYGYGVPDGPMTEDTPPHPREPKGRVRLTMWQRAKAAHDAGRVRVVEQRASDYVGAGVGAAGHLTRHAERIAAGKAVTVLGSPDRAHTWTNVADVARALVIAGRDERAWGRVWHVPSADPRTQREALADLARSIGRSPVSVRRIPSPLLHALGVVAPPIRALAESAYMFEHTFVMDSAAFTAAFGLAASAWEDSCRATMRAAMEGTAVDRTRAGGPRAGGTPVAG